MTTATSPELTTQLTALAGQLASVLDQKAGLDEIERAIKAQIRELVPGPDTYDAGAVAITVQTNRRFSQTKAAAAIPAEVLPLVTKSKTEIDQNMVKALLPQLLDDCYDEYDWKVGLK